jgi:hypothetical protein
MENGLPMVKKDRDSRSQTLNLESLEARNLLTLIGSQPTLEVINGPGVHVNPSGTVSILQPAAIQVTGTAQPGPPGSTVQVSIYAQDSEGNLVNGGAPLATVTPNSLGIYRAVVSLPSMIRRDVNFLVARETASAVETSTLAINGTTINNLTGTLSLDPGTLSSLSASISNPPSTITGLGGTITTTSTPISNIAGTITTPAFPISTGGTAGPATSTLLGGTGTLGAQVGTLAGGTANVPATTSTLTQTGTATESARTGALSNGTGNIAATTGTATQLVQEVATSTPVVILIHQPKSMLALGVRHTAARHAFPRIPAYAHSHILARRRH